MTFNDDELAAIFGKLDVLCWSCGPTKGYPVGYVSMPDDDGACSICEGRALVPTTAGRLLLQFMEAHGFERKAVTK